MDPRSFAPAQLAHPLAPAQPGARGGRVEPCAAAGGRGDHLGTAAAGGWQDLIQELVVMSESLNQVSTIKDEKSLYEVQGQLSILNMLITLEEQTKLIDTDNSIT